MNTKLSKNKIFYLVILAFIFSSYQNVDAQKKKPSKPKPEITVKAVPPDVAYTVSMSKPSTHLLEVEMRMNWTQMPEKLEVKMPVWTPGSYLVREYARHVQDFVAIDASGNALDWGKISKNTWQIETKGAKDIKIGYRVYSNELTVRTNELNYEHAFFTPAALLMFPKDQLNIPSTVKVNPFGNWKVATGLKQTGTNTFRAENYDILYDSPFEVSNFVEKKFTVLGKPHRYVVTGEGNYDLDKMAADTAKIIEESYKIFGDLPYDDYTFIVNLRGGGGLEHLNSTALQWNRWGFKPEGRYIAFLNLVAHEFFHLWNVKRIRPVPLGPFDYENENYTKLLWVAEGATSYYENVLLNRAGIIPPEAIFQSKAEILEDLSKQPGRFQTSLEEASFDAWIKYYRADENRVNNQISYYDKGDVVNFMLDLRIRQASNGAKSLDDVMRYLYDEFFKKGKNYTPEDYQKVSEMMAGTSLEDFFTKYVSGRDELEPNDILQSFGLQMIKSRPESDSPYFGANLSDDMSGVRVTSNPSGTPTYEAGLNFNDVIIAVDGYQVANRNDFNFQMSRKKAGDKVKVTLFRHNKLFEFDVTLGRTPASAFAIVPIEQPTADQTRLYEGYIGANMRTAAMK